LLLSGPGSFIGGPDCTSELAAATSFPSGENVQKKISPVSSRLATRQEEEESLTAAERAAGDRTWAFGHIIVDEAQELSEMDWRMLMRRCPGRSMTLVGD